MTTVLLANQIDRHRFYVGVNESIKIITAITDNELTIKQHQNCKTTEFSY